MSDDYLKLIAVDDNYRSREHHNQQVRQKNDLLVEAEAKLKLVSESYDMDKTLWATKVGAPTSLFTF